MVKIGLKERVANLGLVFLIATFCAIEIILRPIVTDGSKNERSGKDT